ncbi:MAG: hypothetical protein ACLUFU_00235 [Bacilli bacterium]
MVREEILEFCEYYKISIKKFIKENYGIFNDEVRNRIKHEDISGFVNLIPVSLFFAYRYRNLVATGKLVIVEDDYHKYSIYINPRIIRESIKMYTLKEELEALNEDNKEDLLQIEYLLKIIRDLEENQRIIKHFERKKQEFQQETKKQSSKKGKNARMRIRSCK